MEVQPATKHSTKNTITRWYNPPQNILLSIQLHGFNVDTDIDFLYRATFDFEVFFFTDNLPHTTSEHTTYIVKHASPLSVSVTSNVVHGTCMLGQPGKLPGASWFHNSVFKADKRPCIRSSLRKKDVFNQLDDMVHTQQQTTDSLNVPVARAELFCLLVFSEKRIWNLELWCVFLLNLTNLSFIQIASSTSSLTREGGIYAIASLRLWQNPFSLCECAMYHSGRTWRVCWWEHRQDRKGVILVVTASVGLAPHGKQHTFWSSIRCTILARRSVSTSRRKHDIERVYS